VTIRVGFYNDSKYYSNNKKFIAKNLFLATNLVDCHNKIYFLQYYPHITTIYKFGGNNTYLMQQKNSCCSGIHGNRPISSSCK
jgi:hypothetical protein